MDKQHRKAAVKRWKLVERAELLAGMPISPDQLHRLLDYLDEYLTDCDRTPKLTKIFLHVEDLEKGKVLAWLGEQGGYCDCEVLANLAYLDSSFQAPAPVPRVVPQKSNRVPRDLQTLTGWNLSNLPAPWRVANLYVANEPVRLELGKKGGCSITFVDAPFMNGDHSSDEFWSCLWYDRTELPPRGKVRVSHNTLNLPEEFTSTLVESPCWLPVYCWIFPRSEAWYLEVKTESRRCAGDLPQISSLVLHLANHPR